MRSEKDLLSCQTQKTFNSLLLPLCDHTPLCIITYLNANAYQITSFLVVTVTHLYIPFDLPCMNRFSTI